MKLRKKIPVIDQTKNDVIGYHNNNDYVIANENNPVITFANHTCNLRLMTLINYVILIATNQT